MAWFPYPLSPVLILDFLHSILLLEFFFFVFSSFIYGDKA
jgi:hypothetical protein